jgi:hypothetical protein
MKEEPPAFYAGECQTGLAFEEAALRHYGQLVLEEVVAYLSSIQERPVWQPMPASVRRRLGQQELPMEGIAFEETLAFLRETVLPYPQGNGHPRFAGWINSVPAHASVLLKPLAAALNPNCGIGDHAGQELERCAVRWIMELCAFPPEGSAGSLRRRGAHRRGRRSVKGRAHQGSPHLGLSRICRSRGTRQRLTGHDRRPTYRRWPSALHRVRRSRARRLGRGYVYSLEESPLRVSDFFPWLFSQHR